MGKAKVRVLVSKHSSSTFAGHHTGGPLLLLLPGLRSAVRWHVGEQARLAEGFALSHVRY